MAESSLQYRQPLCAYSYWLSGYLLSSFRIRLFGVRACVCACMSNKITPLEEIMLSSRSIVYQV